MTLVKPTLEDALEKEKKRIAELELRTALWYEKRKRFIRKMSLASGIILALSARFMALGGSMSLLAYGLFFLTGGLLGWLIATYALGLFRGMFLYLGGSWLVWLLCFTLSWWVPVHAEGLMGYGPLILMVCGWLGWVVTGAILGMISDTYDNDSAQI